LPKKNEWFPAKNSVPFMKKICKAHFKRFKKIVYYPALLSTWGGDGLTTGFLSLTVLVSRLSFCQLKLQKPYLSSNEIALKDLPLLSKCNNSYWLKDIFNVFVWWLVSEQVSEWQAGVSRS